MRLKDFVASGKLELSLKHFLELAMANNTDIQLQLISLEIPKNNILAAFGVWDPKALASFTTTRATTVPTNATAAQNAASLTKSLTQPYSLQYSQTLPEGLSYTASFSGAKSSQTNSYNNYNPALTANMRFSVTQPLIQNRGSYVNRIPLMTAQSNYRISDYAHAAAAPDAGEHRRDGLLERDPGAREREGGGERREQCLRVSEVHAEGAATRGAVAARYL